MHNIRFASYPENCDKAAVKKNWDEIVRHEDYQEGASGLYNSIRWLNVEPLENYEQAEKYLEEHDRGNYDNLAVRYYDTDSIAQESREMTEAWKKFRKALEKYNQLNSKFHFSEAKSAFIGCKNCGSKIAASYLKSNFCPVCRTDMRPKTTLKAIEAAKSSMKQAEEKLRKVKVEEAKKLKSKAKVKWLVKVEYHT